MLSPWTTPTAVCLHLEETAEDQIPTFIKDGGQSATATVNQELSDQQKEELMHLLEEFADVLQDVPGKITICIDTGSATPVHQPLYCLLKARHEIVQ